MTQVLVEIPLPRPDLDRLREMSSIDVFQVPFHDAPWNLDLQEVPAPELILCRLPPSNLDELPNLKVIQLGTVGYEHLKDRGFANRSIRVCNARGIFDTAIAEWNVSMMIALARDLRGMVRNQEQGIWDRADCYATEIRTRVVGLWGYGGIGRETARLCKALGMTVHVLVRSPIQVRSTYWSQPGTGDPKGQYPDRVFTSDQRHEFLAGLDYLILALPHTRESDGIVGPEEFDSLPNHAYFLNPSRGKIVQEAALLDALQKKSIAGAAIDTHFRYPLPADHPLWRFPNVILTPHVSGSEKSDLYRPRVAALFADNLNRYQSRLPLWNEITQKEWLEA